MCRFMSNHVAMTVVYALRVSILVTNQKPLDTTPEKSPAEKVSTLQQVSIKDSIHEISFLAKISINRGDIK